MKKTRVIFPDRSVRDEDDPHDGRNRPPDLAREAHRILEVVATLKDSDLHPEAKRIVLEKLRHMDPGFRLADIADLEWKS